VIPKDKNHGATWAFEVANQTMVCPIIVEDMNPPGQMLIEVRSRVQCIYGLKIRQSMLCELNWHCSVADAL
jgi:hypothetical protein